MGRFETSWELLKVSLGIVMKDKHLLLFPLMSGLVTIGIFVSFIIGIFITDAFEFNWIMVPLYFTMYLGFYFIGIYFNTALIGCATISLEGGSPTVSDGFRIANQNLGRIFAWALLSATIGLILRAIQERVGIVGKLIIAAIGFAWTFATFFMIPVLIYEKHGVWGSVKRSAQVFKNTWGETFISSFGFGIFFFLLGIIGIIPIILGFMIMGIPGLIAGFVFAVIYWVILALIASAAQGVLVAALYRYATTGKVSPEFAQVARAW